MAISFKDGVIIHWNSTLDRIQRVVCSVFDRHHHHAIVTSGRDGQHMEKSKHYEDLALDFRTWHILGQPNPCLTLTDRSELCVRIQAEIQEKLGEQYQVIFETDKFVDGVHTRVQHLHVEFDAQEEGDR